VGVAVGRDRRRRGVWACRLRLDRRAGRCGAVRLGEGNHDVEATFATGTDAQVRMVRGGDGRHDRQAQTVALAVAGAVGAPRWKGRRSRLTSRGGTAGPLLATDSSARPALALS
jgi:hypothetical protein